MVKIIGYGVGLYDEPNIYSCLLLFHIYIKRKNDLSIINFFKQNHNENSARRKPIYTDGAYWYIMMHVNGG